MLARHGYGVLLVDARGHVASGGRAMEFGWYGDQDIAAAVGYLERRADEDRRRIGALGLSIGGEQAVGAMAGDIRIRATVGRRGDQPGVCRQGVAAGRVRTTCPPAARSRLAEVQLTDLLTDASPPISLHDAAMDAAPRRILLIAAGDVGDEQRAGAKIQRGPSTVELWVVPGAGHTGGLRTQPQEWESRVTTFFAATLLGS